MLLSRRVFSNTSKNIIQESYIWNTVAGMLNTFQSVIILMVLTRTNGAFDAGVFALGYSTGCLFMAIGNYSMRNFQATDIKGVYTFSDYLTSRIITLIFMILVSVGYCVKGFIFGGFSFEKSLIVFLICALKAVEAAEDIYYGMYQNHNRLDIASKALTIRYVVSIGVMLLALVITKDLLVACSVTLLISIIAAFLLIYITIGFFEFEAFSLRWKQARILLINTFGVFISGFLSLYIVNAPKYAIDRYLAQEQQAYYGFLAMPVFVVSLLNTFLYQPILTSLAIEWGEGRKKEFIRKIRRQIGVILFLTVGSLIGAYFLGIPVLSLFYGTDLSPYKMELLILMSGGGALAITGFLTIIITIMRRQQDLIIGYCLISVIAFMVVPIIVKYFGITGAAWGYTLLTTGLALNFIVIVIRRIKMA